MTNKRVLMLLFHTRGWDARTVNESRSLIAHGYEVAVLAWDRGASLPEYEEHQGIKYFRLRLRARYSDRWRNIARFPIVWLLMVLRARRLPSDVVHAHGFEMLVPAVLIGKLYRRKIVYDVRDHYATMVFPGRGVGARLGRWGVDVIQWVALKLVDAVLSTCEAIRDALEDLGGSEVTVVGNWKRLEDYQFTSKEKLDTRRRLEIANDDLIVCYFGLFSEENGVLPLVDAVADIDGVSLLLGGSGPLLEEVEERVTGLSNVKYLGWVSYEDIPKYTSCSDIGYRCLDPAVPLHKYGSPNKLFEALAAGNAMISMNVGDCGKVISRYESGILIPGPRLEDIRQAIVTLRDNPDFLAYIRANARKAAEQEYNWGEAEKRLVAVYQGIMPVHTQDGEHKCG